MGDRYRPRVRDAEETVAELKPWKRVRSRTLYQQAHVLVREDALELPDGRERAYPVLALGGSVGVLPFLSEEEVILVRQYRHAIGRAAWELPAGAWEIDVLASRCDEYDPHLLDTLCLMGRVMWGRVSPPTLSPDGPVAGPLRSTPIAVFLREHRDLWLALAPSAEALASRAEARGLALASRAEARARRDTVLKDSRGVGSNAAAVLGVLEARGASFFADLVSHTGLLGTHVEQALAELAALGIVTADGVTGLRALITPEANSISIAAV